MARPCCYTINQFVYGHLCACSIKHTLAGNPNAWISLHFLTVHAKCSYMQNCNLLNANAFSIQCQCKGYWCWLASPCKKSHCGLAWFGSISGLTPCLTMLNVFIQFFLQIFAIIFITHISTKEKRGSIPTNTVSTTLIHDSIEHFFHKKGNAGHIASQGSKGWGSNCVDELFVLDLSRLYKCMHNACRPTEGACPHGTA